MPSFHFSYNRDCRWVNLLTLCPNTYVFVKNNFKKLPLLKMLGGGWEGGGGRGWKELQQKLIYFTNFDFLISCICHNNDYLPKYLRN